MNDYKVVADLDDSYSTGLFDLTLEYRNTGAQDAKNYQVQVQLLDEDHQVLNFEEELQISSGESATVRLTSEIENVKKWTAETPNLYTLLPVLKDANGKI